MRWNGFAVDAGVKKRRRYGKIAVPPPFFSLATHSLPSQRRNASAESRPSSGQYVGLTLDGGRALRVPVSAVAEPVAGEPWPLWVLLFFSYELHEWTRKNGFRAIRGKTAYKFVKFVPFVAKILALTDLSAIYGMLHRTRHR